MSVQQENPLSIFGELKEMNVASLVKVMKALTVAMKTVATELEIKSKAVKPMKAVKPSKAKVAKEDKVKGPTPLHLMKNNAWVAYVKEHARTNGWEAFTVHQKEGDLEVAASVVRDGVHVHDATGKPMIQKESMSYAKHLWSVKTGTGAHKEIYEAFETAYAQKIQDAEPVASVGPAASAVPVVKAKEAKKVVKKAKTAKEEWVPPTEGNVKPWVHKGETYLRNSDCLVWHAIQGGELGGWAGIYNEATDEIEEVEEPLYED